ncbi:[citrate (pro-3S)-lyase] ligase [Enterococcus gallinarum]|uniref:[citrate (pro-3S)-lyase] ligase n=1 Tax=Enterococcus gallinarum TaxID=1353 RepID=UPI001BD81D6D|nr:[citrate (pro-3S)-lyase] ligase [Enterococcus gallinarum]MBR8698153.1 [citrate (pro-3S)-lyase] ligase [Enterococcus gallinarum]MCR1926747.1 [citrate (pro-3S)-lyase] ligase [Enterococcus gallinarum]MDQ6111574.1 [citrate (pro-3S)-lyase] ligase [Enterococcus gallinarum]MDT2679798.1 [citrate (pro-3S)-lyase] ligase [Enterococcus gallinarum]MDT2712881.1 [citrate (pro-3S)-lyase] ligase [Enterococcus gallinarum]
MMSEYVVTKIFSENRKNYEQVMELLKKEDIRMDKNLEYTCGIFDSEHNLIATGSCFGNTLRCLAVSSQYQGEGLMNLIVTHLVNYQFNRGIFHLFVYTKTGCESIFKTLGFYRIAKVADQLVFLENKKNGFESYLHQLQANTESVSSDSKISAIVMNANPFSLGHQYLIEKASKESDLVHVFVVSEDTSVFPFSVRKQLIEKGTSHLNNIVIHPTGPYMISNATFPSYFQKDEESVIRSHALLDVVLFEQIALKLKIKFRYVGEEPFSMVTGIYNQIMKEEFSKIGLKLIEIKRKENNKQIISASKIRQAIKNDDMDIVKTMVPETTLNYILSNDAISVIQKLKMTPNVVHY